MPAAPNIILGLHAFEDLTGNPRFSLMAKSFGYALTSELSRFRQFTLKILPEGNGRDDTLDYEISGSISTREKTLLVYAQLVQSDAGILRWANHFEGKSADLLDLQNSLVREITATLQQQVNYDLISRVRRIPKVKLKAYECWLNGMEELKKGTVESDVKAREYFQLAIAQDPDYSLAYSGMSMTYFNEWSCQLWDRWDLSQNGAFEWAEKAIVLDEENYIAALVLGRIFLYQGAYESSEFYLRKSLGLNSNDPDSLVQIASCFVFLGYTNEAWALYEKAVTLNPPRKASWHTVAAFILFELGEMEKATEYIVRTGKSRWVDANAYFAATYYHLGNTEKMKQYWQAYLEDYGKTIRHGKPFTEEEAIEWMMKINPFRSETRLLPFWKQIGNVPMAPQTAPGAPASDSKNVFLKEAELWRAGYDNRQVQLSEVKGFHDLQKLLGSPGHSYHCAELMGSVLESEGTPLIDENAKKEYQARLLELQGAIGDFESLNDYAGASRAREEYDTLIDHLSGVLGLSGTLRKTGKTVEKARSAVTWRIRSAISKIERAHPSMGKHLSNAVKTGTLCSYLPEKEISWEV